MKVPHALRDGTFWDDAPEPRDTHEKYDLVVVGGGISGLSAARYYQMEFGKNCKILVLDAMDDIGGHARRNEFRTTARTLLSYGGSQSLESPSTYAPPARQLLTDIGIRVERFEKYFDSGFNARHGLGRGLFFDKESWGKDHLVTWRGGTPYSTILEGAPMAAQAKADLAAIYDAPGTGCPGSPTSRRRTSSPTSPTSTTCATTSRHTPTPRSSCRPRRTATGAMAPTPSARSTRRSSSPDSTGSASTGTVALIRGSHPPATRCGPRRTTTSTTSPRATQGSSTRSCGS